MEQLSQDKNGNIYEHGVDSHGDAKTIVYMKWRVDSIDVARDREDSKKASAEQKRLADKYKDKGLQGTSTWILENIELIQNQYLEVIGKFRKGELIEIEIPRECRDILYKSKHGQWLILVRPKHARRPKAASTAAREHKTLPKEYMEIPLSANGLYGTWKPLDEGAAREVEWRIQILPSQTKRNSSRLSKSEPGNKGGDRVTEGMSPEDRDHRIAAALKTSTKVGQRLTRAGAAVEAFGPEVAAKLAKKAAKEREEARKKSMNAIGERINTRKSARTAASSQQSLHTNSQKDPDAAGEKAAEKATETEYKKRGARLLEEDSDSVLSSYTTDSDGDLVEKKATGPKYTAAPKVKPRQQKSKPAAQQPAPQKRKLASTGNQQQPLPPTVQAPVPQIPPKIEEHTSSVALKAALTFSAPLTPTTYQYPGKDKQQTPIAPPAAKMSQGKTTTSANGRDRDDRPAMHLYLHDSTRELSSTYDLEQAEPSAPLDHTIIPSIPKPRQDDQSQIADTRGKKRGAAELSSQMDSNKGGNKKRRGNLRAQKNIQRETSTALSTQMADQDPGNKKRPADLSGQMDGPEGRSKKRRVNFPIKVDGPTNRQRASRFRVLQSRPTAEEASMTDMTSAPFKAVAPQAPPFASYYGNGEMGGQDSSMLVTTQTPSFTPSLAPIFRPVLPRPSPTNLGFHTPPKTDHGDFKDELGFNLTNLYPDRKYGAPLGSPLTHRAEGATPKKDRAAMFPGAMGYNPTLGVPEYPANELPNPIPSSPTKAPVSTKGKSNANTKKRTCGTSHIRAKCVHCGHFSSLEWRRRQSVKRHDCEQCSKHRDR